MAVTIGYVAGLEQVPPRAAISHAEHAQTHGFGGVMATDHYQPWVPAQGQASFVWNVLAALGERTRGDLGPGACTPTFRWHPAMVAQASATLAAMYPGRHWLGIGSGEALNEHVVGQYWPEPRERINRMFEAIDIISRLFASSLAGRDYKHAGEHFRLEATRLWTMPPEAPEILVATAGPVTARRAGRSGCGLITVAAPTDRMATLLDRFAAGAKEAGRDPAQQSRVVRIPLSWAATDEEARANALVHWPNGGVRFPTADIRSPFEFAQLAKLVQPEHFEDRVVIAADPDVHLRAIQSCVDLGFDRIYLQNVGPNQSEWIETFGREVLPKVVC